MTRLSAALKLKMLKMGGGFPGGGSGGGGGLTPSVCMPATAGMEACLDLSVGMTLRVVNYPESFFWRIFLKSFLGLQAPDKLREMEQSDWLLLTSPIKTSRRAKKTAHNWISPEM
jgi:hypothetical protein